MFFFTYYTDKILSMCFAYNIFYMIAFIVTHKQVIKNVL